MSASKGKPAPPTNNKNQINNKKQPEVKPVKKAWAAEDYVNANTTVEEVKQIKTAFDIFDSDGSGVVDPLQLKNAFSSLGFAASNKFVQKIINDLDTTHAGGLLFEAFLHLATGKFGQSHTKEEIEKVFKSFDLQKNGKINAEEFRQVAAELGEHLTDEEVDKIFQKTDYDQDGYITAEDFYNVIAQREGVYD